MKEPQPDTNGRVKWGGVSMTIEHINDIKSDGYVWSEEKECYVMTDERKYRKEKPFTPKKIMFGV